MSCAIYHYTGHLSAESMRERTFGKLVLESPLVSAATSLQNWYLRGKSLLRPRNRKST